MKQPRKNYKVCLLICIQKCLTFELGCYVFAETERNFKCSEKGMKSLSA